MLSAFRIPVMSVRKYKSLRQASFSSNRTKSLSKPSMAMPLPTILETGNALNYSRGEFTRENGMRGPDVSKILFLLTDGRAHDYPLDSIMANQIRKEVPNIRIWAYGTGTYYDRNSLINITRSVDKIARETTIDEDLKVMFAEFKGREICIPPPPCIKGSDKPMDLLFVVDASTSLGESNFREQITFLKRLLTHANINKNAVKVAVISYKGEPKLEFNFDKYLAGNISAALDRLNGQTGGITEARKALTLAYALLMNVDQTSGARNFTIPKVVIVLTDGYTRNGHIVESSLLNQLPNTTVYAIAVSAKSKIDMQSLLTIVGNRESRVYHGHQLFEFEKFFVTNHVGFGCSAITGPYSPPRVEGAVRLDCSSGAINLSVKTQQPFYGHLYIKESFYQPGCKAMADYSSRGEPDVMVRLAFPEGKCGVKGVRGVQNATSGTFYHFVAVVQFHPQVITRSDQTLDLSCFKPDTGLEQLASPSVFASPKDVTCTYSIQKFASCITLEAPVGDIVRHYWRCPSDSPGRLGIMVHDCVVESDEVTLPLIDSDGCAIDDYMLETPRYFTQRYPADRYLPEAEQDMGMFKFPNSGSVRFRCLISICDQDDFACRAVLSDIARQETCALKRRLGSNEIKRTKREFVDRKVFANTVEVATRRINVLENRELNPNPKQRYCTTY